MKKKTTSTKKKKAAKKKRAAKFPVVSGALALTDTWSITLPGEFWSREEEGCLVLWRHGLTAWFKVWAPEEPRSQASLLKGIVEDASPERFDERRERRGGVLRFEYRLDEDAEDGRRPALYCFAVGPADYLQIGIYFDSDDDIA